MGEAQQKSYEQDLFTRLLLSSKSRDKTEFYTILSDEHFFVPIREIVDIEDEQGIRKYITPSEFRNNARYLPIFTARDLLNIWAKELFRPVSLSGFELGLALESGVGVVINPGQKDCLLVSHQDFLKFLQFISERERVEREHMEDRIPTVGGHNTPLQFRSVRFDDELINNLRTIFVESNEVVRAYLAPANSNEHRCVLGLLTEGLDPEKRFRMISQVAQLSKDTYGEVGSIEVCDDLSFPYTQSWNIFKTLVPIYERGVSHETSETIGEEIYDDVSLAIRTRREKRPTLLDNTIFKRPKAYFRRQRAKIRKAIDEVR